MKATHLATAPNQIKPTESTRQTSRGTDKSTTSQIPNTFAILYTSDQLSTMATEKPNIPILDRNNHESWFRQQKIRLKGKQVFYTCEQRLQDYAGVATVGTIAQGLAELDVADSISGQAQKIRINIDKRDKYEADQAKALSLLFQSISEDDQALTDEYDTVYAFWTHLQAKYSLIDESTASKYMTKLQTFTYRESDGIKSSWDRLKLYRRKVINADSDLQNTYKDKVLLNILLGALPEAYEGTIDGLRVQKSLSVDDKIKFLEEKEYKLRDKAAEHGHAAFDKRKTAKTHRRGSSGSPSDQYRSRAECYLCYGKHIGKHCPYLEIAQEAVAEAKRKLQKPGVSHSFQRDSERKRSSDKKLVSKARDSFARKPKAFKADAESSPKEPSITSDDDATLAEGETNENVYLSSEEIRKATPSIWACDSAATSHMSDQSTLFRSMIRIPRRSIKVGGGVIYSDHKGEVDMVCVDGSKATLTNVLYVPKLGVNLLSGRQVCRHGLEAGYDESSHWFRSKADGRVIIKAEIKDGLYIVTHVASRGKQIALSASALEQEVPKEFAAITANKPGTLISQDARYQLMHRRFNHLGPDKIRNLHKVTTISIPIKIPSERKPCSVCALTKMTNRIPTKLSNHKDDTLALIQFDIAGPFLKSIRGNRYFLLIIDSFTRKNWVITLKQKSDAIAGLKAWKRDVELETTKKVRVARTDNAPELLKAITEWRNEGAGTRSEQTTTASSHQNGPAERNIRTAEADMRAMLKEADLPLEFWDEAVEHDAYIRNRTDTGPVVDGSVVSPQEAYTGQTPSVDHVRVWGYKAYAYIHPKTIPAGQRHDKLRDTAREGVFMGCIDSTTKHFKVYCPELGYTQRFSRVIVDESIRGGSIELRLRGETGPGGTTNLQPDRLPRGRPRKEDLKESPVDTVVVGLGTKPKLVPQVIVKPYMPEPGIKVLHFDENNEQILDTDKEDILEKDTEPALQGQDDDVPTLNPVIADEPEGLGERPTDAESLLPEQKPENHYFTRRQAKRKRSDSMGENDRFNKIVKAMIAQQLSIQADGIEHAFPATEVQGIPIPKTYKEAVHDPQYGVKWKEAIREELVSLIDNSTWKVVVPPKGTNIVSSKWVFTVKTTQAGGVERFKARLVARGFSQVHGEDYHETFAPTVRMDTLRLFFALAAAEDLECRQYDIKNAFTESHLKEKIYMAAPEGFGVKRGQVLEILRSLYGLKQAARDWNLLLKKELLGWGFKQSLADPCMFIHSENSVKVLVYVDDIVGIAKSKEELAWFYERLSMRFNAKDLGDIHKILGIRVLRNRERRLITIDQEQYLRAALDKFGFGKSTYKNKSCPSSNYDDYTPATDKDTRINVSEYQQAIGTLMYAMILTRPDIAFAIGKLSQFMSDPCERHGHALKKLMRYLNSTITQKIRYGAGNGFQYVTVYSDADWASDKTDRKSVSGFTVMFQGGPISWGSKKQRSVATSSCESEYMALAMCSKQGQWIAQILRDLGRDIYISKNGRAVQMLGDNQGALALVENPHLHERSKHIDISYHFIRDLQEKGKLTVAYVPTDQMVADGLTKPLQRPGFVRFKELLGVIDYVSKSDPR